MAHNDESLIKECLVGNSEAFGFLVDKYKGAVHVAILFGLSQSVPVPTSLPSTNILTLEPSAKPTT